MERFRTRFAVGSVLVACASALALQHGAEAGRIAGLAALLALGLAALRWPVVAAVSLLPMLYAIPPAPREVGPAELGVAGLAAALLVGTTLLHWATVARLIAIRCRWVAFGATTLVIVNAAIALHAGTPAAGWLRGAVPFGFLVLLVPITALILDARLSVRDLIFSVCAASLLFGAAVLGVFHAERLWEDTWWLYDPEKAEWTRIAADRASELGDRVSRWGPMRVTQFLPRATDPLVGTGLAAGCLLFALPGGRWARFVGLSAATVAALAVSATVTRSYIGALIVASLTIVTILFVDARRSRDWAILWRYLAGSTIVVVIVAAFLSITGLDAQIAGRVRQATTTLAEDVRPPPGIAGRSSTTGSVSSEAGNAGDENLHARVAEYRVAWRKFLDAPLLGNGLGTSHVIRYPIGHGEFREERVGYVHNWVLYFLMTGGVVGLLGYAFVLGGAGLTPLLSCKEVTALGFVTGTIALLASYGLFFAVFRLISFNVLVAMCWAVALATGRIHEGEH